MVEAEFFQMHFHTKNEMGIVIEDNLETINEMGKWVVVIRCRDKVP